jgi:uncharacterized protein
MKEASNRVIAAAREAYGDKALVTGASSGIGEAFATLFARSGIAPYMVSDEAEALEAVRAAIVAETGVAAVAIPGDLADAVFRESLAERCSDAGILVNCAGFGILGYFVQYGWERYRRMLEVDEEAVLHLSHRFCRRFYDEDRRGAIINVSSANADFLRGAPFSAVYSASKSMINNFTEAVAHEMRPLGVDLINVSPGPTRTSFQAKANTKTLSFAESPESVAIKAMRYLGRRGTLITNPATRAILRTYHFLPLPEGLKIRFRAFVFRRVLGKAESIAPGARAGPKQHTGPGSP